jgi:hypothetical protein
MTHGTIVQPLNVVFLYELLPQSQLIDGWNPLVVENLFARTHEPLRFSMALKAPLHLECLLFPHKRHLVDPPMTRVATYPFFDVDAVVEVDEIGEIVQTVPLDRFAGTIAFSHRFQHGAVLPDLGMTSHTRFRGGDARKSAVFDRGVAVPAVYAETADMVLVAERNGLLSSFLGSSNIG